LLSPGRFDRYVTTTGSEEAGEQLYEWNLRIAGAWYETLGMFEVVLRNALDKQLITYHKRVRSGNGDWYTGPGMPWAGSRLDQQINEARSRATLRGSIPEIHGKVIAELTFGFWRYILASHYQNTLWAPALRRAFPHLRSQKRGTVYTPINRLHDLRNRVAHHEPIHTIDHATRHADLLRAAGWVDPAAEAWINASTRVPEVLKARP
jgi:hypothetical protein